MVTIIIPNYNGYVFLKDCLEALQPQLSDRVHALVVDNGSTDESVGFLTKLRQGQLEQYDKYQEIDAILLPNNTGFAGAVNAGIKHSRTKYVILLNNDTKVLPGFVNGLVAAMEQDKYVFAGSACMLQMHAPELIDDAGDEYCALGWAFARGKGKSMRQYQIMQEVFAACGGAGIYRRAVFDEIGLFDESFFAYLEDIDISYRARIHGYRNIYVPRAKVLHVGSGFSGSKHNAFKVSLASRNSVYLAWKNMPTVQWWLNAPFLFAGRVVKAVFFAAKGLGRVYLKGLYEGHLQCKAPGNRSKKMHLNKKHLKAYCQIQLLLWRNMFRIEH